MFEQPPFLRTREVARLCGVRPERVRGLVREGVLHPVRLNARGWFRFRREDIERLLQNGASANGGESTRAAEGSAAAPLSSRVAALPGTPTRGTP